MTARPPLLGLRHVALFVTDLTAAERFWVDVMGYVVEWRPDDDNVYLCGGSDNLALHRVAPIKAGAGETTTATRAGDIAASSADIVPATGARLDHIGLAVPTAADVDAWAAHLIGHGVALQAAPRTHRDGSRSLYFRGPDGLLVQIIHHLPLTGL